MEMSWIDSQIMRRQSSRRHAVTRPQVIELTSVTCVALEFSGVLCDDTAWQRWFFQLLTRMGLHTQYALFFQTFESEYLTAVYRGELDYWQALRSFLYSSGLTKGQIVEIEAAAAHRRRKYHRELRPMPGLHSTLARLVTSGQRLAVLGNSSEPSGAIQQKLKNWRIADYFEEAISSNDLQCALRSPRFYQSLADRMSIACTQVLFVSANDMHLSAARQAGLIALGIHGASSTDSPCLERLDGILAVLPPGPVNKAA